jgi:hypothetical protein
VLERRAALDALSAAVARADRLVLLGDVVELRRGPRAAALAAAAGPLRAIAGALRADAELVVLAGNHDHGLIAEALADRARRGEPLGTAAELDPVPALTEALGGRAATLAYPGVWLREDVWATHGHLADRHTTVPMLERVGAGVMARLVREAPGGPTRAEDYEAALAPMYAWIDALAEFGGSGARGDGVSAGAWSAMTGGRSPGLDWRRRALKAGFPVAIAALNRAGVGPLSARLHGGALRRSALAAIDEVARRLSVDARWVVFGHTHRAGPLPGDDPSEWRRPGGGGLVNCGCWVTETAFLEPDPATSPYRAGFAVWVTDEPGRAPELVNLLD